MKEIRRQPTCQPVYKMYLYKLYTYICEIGFESETAKTLIPRD